MKQTSVLRVTGEICFFFSILHIFDFYRSMWLPMALFTAACFLLGFLIVRLERWPLRLLLSLLPGLCFLMAPLHPLLAFPALAWIYYILVMTRGNCALPLEEYRRSYTWMLVLSLFSIAANIANSTLFRGHLISVESLVYVALFLILGVIAMRRMQMGGDMSRSWKLSNLLSVAGFPLIVVGVAILLFLLLRFTKPALEYLLAPVGQFILWLFNKLFPGGSDITFAVEVTVAPHVPKTGFSNNSYGHAQRALDDYDGFESTHHLLDKASSIGAYVLLGILLLLALYLILRHARRNRPLTEGADYYEETEEDAPDRKKKRKKAPRVTGNARQLRRIYQTYMEFVNESGMSIGKADTSQDILERSQKIKETPEAERLRQLYIAARYGDPNAVTREQVKEAQACLEVIVDAKPEAKA